MSSRKWSDEELIKFVQLYRKEECLWNIKLEQYRNKSIRFTALQNICTEMNIEGLTVDDVKAKIKSLRCTYYLECDKINKSRAGTGNVYIPKMKWFSKLHDFIKVVTVKRKTDNADYEQANAEPVDTFLVPIKEEPQPLENEPPPKYEPPPSKYDPAPPKNELPRPNHAVQKKSRLSQMASIVAEINKVNNSVNENDDIDIFGMSVAAQMRKLTEEQAVIARDEIQSILTRCRLADLRSKSLPYT